MSRPRTFERVYAAIRDQLREGRFRPGDRLEPAFLSENLNASVTPVRDALHRLAGERLVEAPRHEGFRAPALTETILRHLYAWHLDLLLLAMMKRSAERLPPIEEPGVPSSHFEQHNLVFERLVQAGGNPEHVQALRNAAERLEPVQRLEALFLDAVEPETERIVRAIRDHDRKGLRSSLVRYHRRRQQIVPELIAKLYEQRADP